MGNDSGNLSSKVMEKYISTENDEIKSYCTWLGIFGLGISILESFIPKGGFEFEFKITELGSFEKAQVCKGGIPLTEINLNTFESIIVKDLYFAGEIIDINGDCGGYNLTFAWLSGIKAGENIW